MRFYWAIRFVFFRMLLGQGSNRSASYHEVRLFVVLFIPLFLGLIALDVPNETAGCIFIGISIFDLIMSWDDEQVETAYSKIAKNQDSISFKAATVFVLLSLVTVICLFFYGMYQLFSGHLK
jgi:hypothetical protein